MKPFQSFVFHDLHHEMVLCVAFSHDGEEVVAGGMSGHVKVGRFLRSIEMPRDFPFYVFPQIFNLRARSLRLQIADHKEPVNVCRFSADGR